MSSLNLCIRQTAFIYSSDQNENLFQYCFILYIKVCYLSINKFKLTIKMSNNMFGRNSQSAYGNSTNYSSNYSSNSYGNNSNSYGYGNNSNSMYSSYRQNNSNNSQQKLGSYRVRDYDSTSVSDVLSRVQYKQYTPISISIRQETMHLSPLQIRAEDYYLIRTKALDQKHRKGLDNWIDKKAFNPSLMSQDSMATNRLGISSNQTSLTIDAIERLCNGGTSRYGNNTSPYGNYGSGNSYNSNNNYQSNSSNNMFSQSNSGNNPFGNNNSNNSQYNSNSTYNTRSNNPFSSNNSGNSNNMFMSNNSNNNNNMSGSRNMFNNNSSNPFSNSNNSNSNNSNNPFANNNSNNNNNSSNNMFRSNNNNMFNNNSNNMFNNSNNNSNNNNNPFSSNNNNNRFSSNNNNPFSNNNNNSNNNNPFNNNNNNNNSNNMFNNNNNNNRNNMFGNNNNNNPFSNNNNYNNNRGGNNLFNNNNSNNNNNLFNNNNGNYNNNGYGYNGYNPQLMLQMFQIMGQWMIHTKNSNNNTNNMNTNNNTNQNGYSDSFNMLNPNTSQKNDFYTTSQRIQKKYAEWFTDPFDYDDDQILGQRKKNKKNQNRTIVVVKESHNGNNNNSSFIKNGTGMINNMNESLFDNRNKPIFTKHDDSVTASQYRKFYTSKQQQVLPQSSPNDSIIKHTSSSFMINGESDARHDNSYSNKANFNNFNSNSRPASFAQTPNTMFAKQYDSRSSRRVAINQPVGFNYKYRICCIWAESLKNNSENVDQFYIQGNILLQTNPTLLQLTDILLTQIKNQIRANPSDQKIIRRDASLILQLPHQQSRNQYSVKGTLMQNKINVKKGYQYLYDKIEGWNVTNLTITNKIGRVMWPGSINIRDVDFQQDIDFAQNNMEIQGTLDQKYDKIYTMNSLPSLVEQELPNRKQAIAQMERIIKKSKKDTNNQGIILNDIDFDNRTYTIRINKKSKLDP